MILLEDIFAEYVAKRRAGMSANETLNLLRGYIEPLAKQKKRELADDIRNFEEKQGAKLDSKTQTQKVVQPQTATKSVHKSVSQQPSKPEPLQKKVKSLRSNVTQTTTVQSLADAKFDWITCANCDSKNRTDSVFCYACGHLLDQVQGKFGTRKFSDADTSNLDTSYFSVDSVLVLRVREDSYDYDIRPQLHDHELVIGRSTEQSAMVPDIDLAQHGGEKYGVSRLHLAVKYVADDQNLQVHDLGSANGSFINGQKIHPNEVRVLRDGDQIRLGKMILLANFFHPGEEIPE